MNQKGHGELSILALLAAITWILALTGCGSSAGWRVEFGVAPVNAINNSYSLNEDSKKKEP
jgi:hypothetical protein